MLRFCGQHWPRFHVEEARRYLDGAPMIYCVSETGWVFVFSVERWLDERRSGGIVPAPDEE